MSEQSNNAGLGDVAYVVRSVEGATAIARGNITNNKIETVDEIRNRLMAYDDIKRENDELRACYEQAARIVAKMHYAAMGCVCGPKKSVIGDIEDLRRERDELREALREILKVSEPTPVLTYQKMEDIASKALKDTVK